MRRERERERKREKRGKGKEMRREREGEGRGKRGQTFSVGLTGSPFRRFKFGFFFFPSFTGYRRCEKETSYASCVLCV